MDVPWNVLVKLIEGGGLFGVGALLMWLNMRWVDRQREEDHRQVAGILKQYREDMAEARRMYDNNVVLVQETQGLTKQVIRIAEELTSVVALNTRVQESLVVKIDNNLFCPMVRAKGPQG